MRVYTDSKNQLMTVETFIPYCWAQALSGQVRDKNEDWSSYLDVIITIKYYFHFFKYSYQGTFKHGCLL